MPTVSKEEVVKAADPPLRATVPRVVDPEVKVTLPVGVGPLLVTLAVNVTLCPAKLGFAEDVAAVAEAAWFTVTATPCGGISRIVCVAGVAGADGMRSNGQSCKESKAELLVCGVKTAAGGGVAERTK